MASLYTNGRKVPSSNGMLVRPSLNHANGEMFENESLDFAPLLKTGPNAVALHASRNGTMPHVYFTLTVVMESGEVVRIASDDSWKYVATEPLAAGEKVSTPGFEDSKWSPADGRPGAALNYRKPSARPAYTGLMVLTNAVDPYLFFKDSAPVEFAVQSPPGLSATHIEWRVQQFKDRKFTDVTSGITKESRITAGIIPRGVYVLHATLKRGETVLEERIP